MNTVFSVGDRVRFSQVYVAKHGQSFGRMVGEVTAADTHPNGGQMVWVQFEFTGQGFRIRENESCPLEIV